MCFPFRLYNKEIFDKFNAKIRKEWFGTISSQYESSKYFGDNFDNDKLKLLKTKTDSKEEMSIINLNIDYQILKQYNDIPKIFT